MYPSYLGMLASLLRVVTEYFTDGVCKGGCFKSSVRRSGRICAKLLCVVIQSHERINALAVITVYDDACCYLISAVT